MMLIWKIARENKKSLVYLVILAILMVSFSSTLTYLAVKYEEVIQRFTMLDWTIFYMAASLTMALAFTPTTLIALVSGYFLGWYCVPGVLSSYLVASLFGYIIAGFFDKGKFTASISNYPEISSFFDRLKESQITFIILARISPVLPFAMMNVVLAALRVSVSKFIVAGFIGMLPRTLLFIWVGTQFRELNLLLQQGGNDYYSRIAVIVLLLVSIGGFFFYFKNLLKKKMSG